MSALPTIITENFLYFRDGMSCVNMTPISPQSSPASLDSQKFANAMQYHP
jgi:hypothetical protein